MFCRKCGHQMSDDARFCDACGTAVDPAAAQQPSAAPAFNAAAVLNSASAAKVKKLLSGKWVKITAAALAVVILIAVVFGGGANRCEASGCRNEKKYGDYCIEHVCMYGSCTSRRTVGQYCSYHASSANAPAASYANPNSDLSFTNIQIEHNSSYTVVTGKVTNYGDVTYTFVKIKGTFKTSSGTVVDTDWTYAVGSEGLAPGESTTFRMSIPKDRTVTKCTISILDYDT